MPRNWRKNSNPRIVTSEKVFLNFPQTDWICPDVFSRNPDTISGNTRCIRRNLWRNGVSLIKQDSLLNFFLNCLSCYVSIPGTVNFWFRSHSGEKLCYSIKFYCQNILFYSQFEWSEILLNKNHMEIQIYIIIHTSKVEENYLNNLDMSSDFSSHENPINYYKKSIHSVKI